MPRTPAVYEQKKNWRLDSQADPDLHLWNPPTIGVTNSNYKSAQELADAVEKQLVESVKKGQAIAMSEGEARAKFGDSLVIASLGAQIRDDTGPEIRIRMLFDGTKIELLHPT